MKTNMKPEVRFASIAEQKNWNQLVVANPDRGNLLQSLEYSEIKATIGWNPQYLIVGEIAIMVLERHFALFRHWYIPKCSGAITSREARELMDALVEFARSINVSVITLDPEQPDTEDFSALGLVRRFDIQANVTTKILDISMPLDELLASLPQKARYSIRRAIKDGVKTQSVPTTDENCKIMFDLMAAAVGKRSKMYDFDYYREFWQRYDKTDLGRLFFAYHEGRIVAGAFALAFGTKGTYKDGGSVRDRKAYGASHLLQWEVIMWLKRLEVTSYDLCGVPPADQAHNPMHRLHGVGQFKASFVPDTTEYAGTYDILVQPRRGWLWHSYGERATSAVYRRVLNNSYY